MVITQKISNISHLPAVGKGRVLTIGNFDGVHLGHQQILMTAKQAAVDKGTELIAMTFEPHPLAILRPEMAPGVLTPLAAKNRLLAESGVDRIFIVESSPQLLALSPEKFVQRFLVENISPCLVVEGESFNFGSGRRGSIATLQELGDENGIDVVVVEAKEVELAGGRIVNVSSTIIRNLLADGGVGDAATALGRGYRLTEKIIPGRGKGKRLGFATANMKLPAQLVPAHGVYAGFAAVADAAEELPAKAKIPAALSIGTSATYGDDHPLLIEAHFLTGDVENLYDKYLAIDFVKRIRGQEKFESESQLAAQIAKDCEAARNILAAEDDE